MQNAEEMLENKLNKMRKTYEQEFEGLASQFEEMKKDLDYAQDEENKLKKIISEQEAHIIQNHDLYEAAGRDLGKGDDENRIEGDIEGEDQEKLLDFVIDMSENPEEVQAEIHDIVNEGDVLLK